MVTSTSPGGGLSVELVSKEYAASNNGSGIGGGGLLSRDWWIPVYRAAARSILSTASPAAVPMVSVVLRYGTSVLH
jgi:hypothetical protein